MTKRAKKQAPVPEPVVLDAAVLKPFEIGARLDALLCYPKWAYEKQLGVADAICATLVAHSIAVDRSRKAELWGAFPKYKVSRSGWHAVRSTARCSTISKRRSRRDPLRLMGRQ